MGVTVYPGLGKKRVQSDLMAGNKAQWNQLALDRVSTPLPRTKHVLLSQMKAAIYICTVPLAPELNLVQMLVRCYKIPYLQLLQLLAACKNQDWT